jgi:hypothetical protein
LQPYKEDEKAKIPASGIKSDFTLLIQKQRKKMKNLPFYGKQILIDGIEMAFPQEAAFEQRLPFGVFINLFLFQYGHSCSFSLDDLITSRDFIQCPISDISGKKIDPLCSTPF